MRYQLLFIYLGQIIYMRVTYHNQKNMDKTIEKKRDLKWKIK